jgi:topoisomerase-4 subunit A
MAAFEIDDIQADAILNTRLRQLAKLEEMELRREHADLAEERDGIQGMLADDKMQWKLVGQGLRDVRKLLDKPRATDVRRPSGVMGLSTFAEAPTIDADAAVEALVAREPITVILSEKGWIRAARGRIDDPSELKFKEGDGLAFLVPAETTDKLLLFATDGRFFTLAGDKLPSARGQGEPLRLMLDLDDRVGILAVFPYRAGAKRVLASKAGYGFIMPEDDAVAMRRAGKQVLNVDAKGACFCLPIDGDHLAVVGDNGKALVFPLAELPEMPRGKGVKLQSYREGGLRDGLIFTAAEGAAWTTADGRSRAWPDWREWLGKRAAAGRLVPRGFPASKKFRPRT